MIAFEMHIKSGDPMSEKGRWMTKTILWPVLPRVGDELDIVPPGYAGGPRATVVKVLHWLGHKPTSDEAIQVDCHLDKETDEDWEEVLKAGFEEQ